MTAKAGEAEAGAIAERLQRLRGNLMRVIRGKPEIIEQLIVAVLAGGSVLLEDVPGVGKTTLAKSLAASLDLQFRRVQCTPDLLPADLFGVSVFDPRDGSFHFRRGPIFCNVLLVDEINRASPRTQSALLEVMAERQVTVDGVQYDLDPPFWVIATQNPSGFQGTYPLPESQLDRFLFKLSMDYPDPQTEVEILFAQAEHHPLDQLRPVLSLDELLECQAAARSVQMTHRVAAYLVEIVRRTREDPRLQLGSGPRGSLMLHRAAQASALLEGRDHVWPDDIQNMAPLVLQHRVIGHASDTDASDVVAQIIQDVSVPT